VHAGPHSSAGDAWWSAAQAEGGRTGRAIAAEEAFFASKPPTSVEKSAFFSTTLQVSYPISGWLWPREARVEAENVLSEVLPLVNPRS
jgi:hypothetical protein